MPDNPRATEADEARQVVGRRSRDDRAICQNGNFLTAQAIEKTGAGEGNRTLVFSLGVDELSNAFNGGSDNLQPCGQLRLLQIFSLSEWNATSSACRTSPRAGSGSIASRISVRCDKVLPYADSEVCFSPASGKKTVVVLVSSGPQSLLTILKLRWTFSVFQRRSADFRHSSKDPSPVGPWA